MIITSARTPGGITIRSVCWLVRSFINIRPTTALAGRRSAGGRQACDINLAVALQAPGRGLRPIRELIIGVDGGGLEIRPSWPMEANSGVRVRVRDSVHHRRHQRGMRHTDTHTPSCMCTHWGLCSNLPKTGDISQPGSVPDWRVCIPTNVPVGRCLQTHTHTHT